MTGSPSLEEALRRARWLLIDFDGPMCSVFAGRPAPEVAERLRRRLIAAGVQPDNGTAVAGDPFDVLRFAARRDRAAAQLLEEALREEEIEAALTAEPTSGAIETLVACQRTGRPAAIVSNNSAVAVERYLAVHRLQSLVAAVAGRREWDPGLLKPSPHLVQVAALALEVDADFTCLIGDAETDMVAAAAAGIVGIGYANRPGKVDRLTSAGAVAVTSSMLTIARALDT